MKLSIRTNFLLKVMAYSLVIFSCQKKEIPETDSPSSTPSVDSNTKCPNCNLPDTVWRSNSTAPQLIFRFKFDSTLARLNNTGQLSSVLPGNGAQSPIIKWISSNYIELMKTDTTSVGNGTVLYKGSQTTCGGASAIVHCQSVVVKENEVFFSVPLSQVEAGSYKWLRLSLAYQNMNVKVRTTSAGNGTARIASFTGFNTYVSSYKMGATVMTPTLNGIGNKLQGYWGYDSWVFSTEFKIEGQAAQTTVVNTNTAISNPNGSSYVYGQFYNSGTNSYKPIDISGIETQDISITVLVSTNQCFEWKEVTFDGLFQPEIGESIYDLGTRGIIPTF